jgi:hypothetical protein
VHRARLPCQHSVEQILREVLCEQLLLGEAKAVLGAEGAGELSWPIARPSHHLA